MDLKATLNLPRTDFPMKANLARREPEILQLWEQAGLYRRMVDRNAGGPRYVLHDGPPYANGNIHWGHVLNKVLKDFIVKYRNMRGFQAEYIPGWDCHGLPIELKVTRAIGEAGETGVGPSEIRRRCRAYAERFVSIQRDEFRRLGVLGEWERPYLTMSAGYESVIGREIARFIEQGYVYQARKPVYWCASCGTALAEAEVEYRNHASPSVYVAFPVRGGLGDRLPSLAGRPVSVVIWTTTPWTLPANLAVCLNERFDYVALGRGESVYIVAEGLKSQVLSALGWKESEVETLATFPARTLDGIDLRHPFLDRASVVLFGEHVTLESGTGCVHTAPGHGMDDYLIGRAAGLEAYAPVDDRGRFTPDVGRYAGLGVFEANAKIAADMHSDGNLLNRPDDRVEHSYPHCWRCKEPVIFRSTRQWFIALDAHELRRRALDRIDRVEWIPAWGRDRIHNMVALRPDWCISRQRVWGIPIPAFRCAGCGETLLDARVAHHLADLYREHTSDVWFDREAAGLLPEGTLCPACGGGSFEKGGDIVDVWFDSGVSWAAVCEGDPRLGTPVDLYLEGSDQHRGWFHSALLTAVATRGAAPYKAVLTHGYVIDSQGDKMSKSLGNFVSPQKTIDTLGAEFLRLWAAAEDYREDIQLSDDNLNRLVDAYRKIRNTLRFLLGHFYDFEPDRHLVPFEQMLPFDRWMVSRLQLLVRRCTEAYDACQFHVVFHRLLDFCTTTLSAFYLDVIKDRAYCSDPAGRERRSLQTALFHAADAMTRLAAPVLSFTAEEAWGFLPAWSGKPESVFLADFPVEHPARIDEALLAAYEELEQVRATVLRALETARAAKAIGHPLEARVRLRAAEPLLSKLTVRREELASLFIVSAVELEPGGGEPDVVIEPHPGAKCPRCWRRFDPADGHPVRDGVCGRCGSVLDRLEGAGA